MSPALRWTLALAAALAVAVVIEIAAGSDHPAVMPVFGFIGCVALIVIAKGLGALLWRPAGSRAGSHEDGADA